MMFIKALLTFAIVLGACHVSVCQVQTIKRLHTAYESSVYDKDSSLKKGYSELCERFIQTFYEANQMPNIYLVFGEVRNSNSEYELAYDNLRGIASGLNFYGADKGLNKAGIRVKIPARDGQGEQMLKLLDYGIKNLKKLKKHRRKVIRTSHGSYENGVSLSHEQITKIISELPSDKIKSILSTSQ
jgi:hypothetical protein